MKAQRIVVASGNRHKVSELAAMLADAPHPVEVVGLAAFQAEFWAANQEQSIGAGFYVEALGVERRGDAVRLAARVWLAPFDQGVVQQTVLEIAPGSTISRCH